MGFDQHWFFANLIIYGIAMALVETSSSTEVLPQLAGKAGQLGFKRVTLRTRLAVRFALQRVVVPRELAWS
jgi:hypothetical protein